MPNEETPTTDTSACEAWASLSGISSHGTSLFGVCECALGGTWPWCVHSAALTSEPIPAAVFMCPTLPFIEPTSSGRRVVGRAAWTAARACSSIGSPTRVPVPWHST